MYISNFDWGGMAGLTLMDCRGLSSPEIPEISKLS